MLLSICIPSYNRFEHLKELLNSILSAKSQEFEVIVVDNGSVDDIYDKIKIKDQRIKIFCRDKLVKGPTNIRLVLNYANGKYAMLCLDKDFIIGEKLDVFLEKLQGLDDVACGYCELNSKADVGEFIFSDDIAKNMYRCGHPSGTFFRNKFIEDESKELDLLNEKSIFYNNPFLTDLLYAKCLCHGKQVIYTAELVTTETLEDAATQKSYTYSVKENNIYFMTPNRIKQFWIFIAHLNGLLLSSEEYVKVVDRLILKTMLEISVGYKGIMSNDAICKHHGMETEDIKKQTGFIQIKDFSKDVMRKGIQGLNKTKLKRYIFINYIKASVKILLYL